jgi:hypothetical protein
MCVKESLTGLKVKGTHLNQQQILVHVQKSVLVQIWARQFQLVGGQLM